MYSSGATCLWWRSVLLLEETGELEENHRPVASSFESSYHTMVTTMCPRNKQSLYINHRVFNTITVRVYVIFHFCDSMWSLWVEANLVVYIYFAFGDPIIKRGGGLIFNYKEGWGVDIQLSRGVGMRSNYQEGWGVEIQLTRGVGGWDPIQRFNPSTSCSFMCLMIWGHRWLFALLILVELWNITIGTFFSYW
jgi:hypothetical protein